MKTSSAGRWPDGREPACLPASPPRTRSRLGRALAAATTLIAVGAFAPAAAHAGKTFDLYTTNSASGSPIHDIAPLNKPNDVNDIPLIGNWDGAGTDRFSLYHPTTRQFVLNKANKPDSASKAYVAGNWGDIPFLGRWNSALAKDVVALYRPENRTFYYPTTGNGDLLDGAVQLSDNGSDLPITGDWNGDGVDTLGAFRPSTTSAGMFLFKNSNTAGWDPQMTISSIGVKGDKPIFGDWNRDNIDTIGLYRPSSRSLYLLNENRNLVSSFAVSGALATDKPVVGDWDGDGIDTFGLFRAGGHAVYLATANVAQPSWVSDGYYLSNLSVEPTDTMLYADWDGNGTDSPGVYRPGSREFFYSNSAQAPTRNSFGPVGDPGDIPLAGHWTNATNRDMPALYRPSNDTFYYPSGSTPAMNASYGLNATPGDIVLAADWNGDGIDTLGLYRPSTRTLWIRNVNENVTWQNAGTGGNPEDLPITGHFRGTSLETFALFRPGVGMYNRFYGANATSNFDTPIGLGDPGDKPAVGDWDGDGLDTVGVYRVIVPQFGGENGFIEPGNEAEASEFISSYKNAESDHIAATKLVAGLWPEEIATVDKYFKDVSIPGGLFRAAGTNEVWWYKDGKRHHITSADIANRLGVNLGNTWRVSTGARDQFALGEPIDGTNVSSWRYGGDNGRVDTTAEADGFIAAFRAASTNGAASELVAQLVGSDRSLVEARMQALAADGTLVIDVSTSQYWFLDSGSRLPFSNTTALDGNGFIATDAVRVTGAAIANRSIGETLTPDGDGGTVAPDTATASGGWSINFAESNLTVRDTSPWRPLRTLDENPRVELNFDNAVRWDKRTGFLAATKRGLFLDRPSVVYARRDTGCIGARVDWKHGYVKLSAFTISVPPSIDVSLGSTSYSLGYLWSCRKGSSGKPPSLNLAGIGYKRKFLKKVRVSICWADVADGKPTGGPRDCDDVERGH